MKKFLFSVVALCVVASTAYAASVSLAWDYTQGSIPAVSFNMYRNSTCSPPWTMLATIPVSIKTYTDTTVLVGNTYCYVADAVSSTGMYSANSNTVSITVPATGITAPSMLRIVP